MGFVPKADAKGLSLTVSGGDAKVVSGTVYEVVSAWQ